MKSILDLSSYGIIAIVCVLIFYSAKLFKTKIYMAKDMESAKKLRLKFLFLSLALYTIGIVIFFLFVHSGNRTFDLINLFIYYGLFLYQSHQISFRVPGSIKSGKKYILYLRGFEYDNYDSYNEQFSKVIFDSFSEFHFCRYLKLFFPVYAVGMTKELISPNGATRIYLNDINWKEEVFKLINNAEMVIILVNDSDSCIWEIENAYFFNKTVFIIDEVKKTAKVRGYLNKQHIYPFPISREDRKIVFHNPNTEQEIILDYENTDKSYKEKIEEIMMERYGMRRLIIDGFENNCFFIVISFLGILIDVKGVFPMSITLFSFNLYMILYLLYCVPLSMRPKFLR